LTAESELAATARTIEVVALDVDGVLTDGGFFWGPDGEEWKRFCFADVMGISRGSRAGLSFALISGEDSPLVDRYAAKLKIAEVHKGCKDKAAALRLVSERLGSPLGRVCFVGDDVNDLAAMEIAGLSAAPRNAQPQVLAAVDMILGRRGGDGAVRELIEFILASR
jgi:3-deoxy-D-manno-octulosonate 8-phosphate phosphatase (KDO 8-P phosphatase)